MPSSKAFVGIPIPYESFEVRIPTVGDTLDPDFWIYLQALTLSQEDLDEELKDVFIDGLTYTPFQYLMIRSMSDGVFKDYVERAFRFFLGQDIFFNFERMHIFIGSPSLTLVSQKNARLNIISEENFLKLQNVINEACGKEIYVPIDPTWHPRRQDMERKKRLRDRIKARQNAKKSSYHSLLVSLCTMGIGITPMNVKELSYAALQELVDRYRMRQNYELEIKIATNPFNTKPKQVSDWME